MCPDLQEYTFDASSKPTTKSKQNSNNLPKIYTINKHSSNNTNTYKSMATPKLKKKKCKIHLQHQNPW